MFGSEKTRRRKQNTKNQFQKLEDRKLLAAIAFDGGQLYLAGDAGNNVATPVSYTHLTLPTIPLV